MSGHSDMQQCCDLLHIMLQHVGVRGRCMRVINSIASILNVRKTSQQCQSMSIKYLYSANNRRSNLRRWHVGD